MPAAQGLREPRPSVDVDVWVAPQELAALQSGLSSTGWKVRVVSTTAQIGTFHSVQYSHALWPVEIDLHDRFPGFLAPPEVVFDLLWERRVLVTVAGVGLWGTDVVASAAIAGLHLLRHPNRSAREMAELTARLEQRLSDEDVAALTDLAAALGASETLAPLLSAIGARVVPAPVHPRALHEWKLRTGSAGMRSVAWVYKLRLTPWRQWPKVIWDALVLTESEIRVLYPHAAPGRWGLLRSRVRRLARGLRSLPGAVAFVLRTPPE